MAARELYTANLMGSLSKKARAGKSATKAVQKKTKSQWPRSMNRANLMAFREHILNKLKKAQEVPAKTPVVRVLANQCDTDAKGASIVPIKFEAPSPNAPFELQVTYERNHLAPPKRCHSEPARLQNSMSAGSVAMGMQNSQSASNLRLSCVPPQYLGELKMTGSGTGECEELFSDFSCNPDMFLSSGMDEKFLNDLELKFNMETGDEGEMFGGSARSMHCPSSSTLSDVETMDIDCIQELLDDSKQVFSPSSSVAASPGGDNHTSTGSASTPVSLSRCNSTSSVDKTSPACRTPECPQREGEEEDTSFSFPEILSIHGSMVLDGVSVLSEGETVLEYQPQHAFLQSHHDPLLAADSLATPPSWN